jgi:hypothetical protein
LDPSQQDYALFIVDAVACDGDANIIGAVQLGQDESLSKHLGMTMAEVSEFRKQHKVKRREDLSHANKNVKKHMLDRAKKKTSVTEAHINLILGVLVAHVNHLRDVIIVRREACAEQKILFDVEDDPVVHATLLEMEESILNAVSHLNGMDASHSACSPKVCEIRQKLEEAGYDSMPESDEKRELCDEVNKAYINRKTNQAQVFVARDESAVEREMHQFQFMKLPLDDPLLQSLENLVKKYINTNTLLGAALAPGGTTMVENLWSLVAILTNGKRLKFGGVRNKFILAASALRQRFGFQWMLRADARMGLPWNPLAHKRAKEKQRRRRADRVRQGSAEYRARKAAHMLARRMVNASRRLTDGAYKGANKAAASSSSIGRYEEAKARKALSGKSSKCHHCNKSHGPMSFACAQVDKSVFAERSGVVQEHRRDQFAEASTVRMTTIGARATADADME